MSHPEGGFYNTPFWTTPTGPGEWIYNSLSSEFPGFCPFQVDLLTLPDLHSWLEVSTKGLSQHPVEILPLPSVELDQAPAFLCSNFQIWRSLCYKLLAEYFPITEPPLDARGLRSDILPTVLLKFLKECFPGLCSWSAWQCLRPHQFSPPFHLAMYSRRWGAGFGCHIIVTVNGIAEREHQKRSKRNYPEHWVSPQSTEISNSKTSAA